MMSFGDAVKKCLNNYTTISGRAQRSEYWWFTLFTLIVVYGLMLIEILVLQGMTLGLLGLVASLGLLLPAICVGVRRLHDRDMSGWWMLLVIVPIASLVLLVLFCLKGTDGENRFGPDPLA